MLCKVLIFCILLQQIVDTAPRPGANLLPIRSKIMNVDNAKSQMRKGMLEYCVLLLLRKEPSYANDIINRLKSVEMIVVEGTLYPLLTRLKKDGMLSYEWRESTQGPPRKYYALTEQGELALAELDGAWNELARTVGLLKAESPVRLTLDGFTPSTIL